eukprot:gnl/TRDRNA2_/TRDRNA2_197002_c0_seq1.p1 gnl/TRDRNA2_/TRDRNA2_197002_c0~~gnl/TRDRNA2_/TRDRNA2_197002_c0_seq1.p1  ORF type:complete len:448 (-),score=62.81 gnl/TRDRNA2_/TRDRNA2_197002_c0_seq1:52-1395(-)
MGCGVADDRCQHTLALHRTLGRSPVTDESAGRHVEWSLYVSHDVVARVRVRLVWLAPKISWHDASYSLEVWVEDECKADAEGKIAGQELAYCRGGLNPKDSIFYVHWLGRLQRCSPVFVAERKKRGELEGRTRSVTVAAALLGVATAVARRFGIEQVELVAEDDGSGKLVEYYQRLGFKISYDKCRPAMRHKQPAMHCPAAELANLAPTSWTAGLVPRNFDSDAFLATGDVDMQSDTDLSFRWGWRVSRPHRARVCVKLECQQRSLVMDVTLYDCHGVCLALARGAVDMKEKMARLHWLGREAKQPVHPNVKGRKEYATDGRPRGSAVGINGKAAEDKDGGKVTAAVALLGVLSAVAAQAGASELQTFTVQDDGSGGLSRFFTALGFVKMSAKEGKSDSSMPMTLSCKTLAECCCPDDWRSELPRNLLADLGANRREVLEVAEGYSP